MEKNFDQPLKEPQLGRPAFGCITKNLAVAAVMLAFPMCSGSAQPCGQAPVGIIAGPITNPANRHEYYLLQPSCWTDAEATAVSMNGHLTTLNNGDEYRWVAQQFSSFGGMDRGLWIGLYDPDPIQNSPDRLARTGEFVWSSGQHSSFSQWLTPDEPDTSLATTEFYVQMLPPNHQDSWTPCWWADKSDMTLLHGVVEIPLPLEIISQPQNLSIGIGCIARLSVTTDATSPVRYQWQFMGTDLAGATESILCLTNVQPVQAGPYRVILANDSGTLASSLAVLSVGSVVAWDLWNVSSSGIQTPPPNLTNVVALACGTLHSLALLENGTVLAWGDDCIGQIDVPPGLSDVIAIAAGGYFSLALRANGTIVAWGMNYNGQITIPAGLTNVIAISALGEESLALKADGTVVGWGNNMLPQPEVPFGLADVVAIAAGGQQHLALKADGTVVAWGVRGSPTVPEGLSNVVAVAGGYYNSLALKTDGSVVDWSNNTSTPNDLSDIVGICAGLLSLAMKSDGQLVIWGDPNAAVPPDLPPLITLATGGVFCLGLSGNGSPHIISQPWSRAAAEGGSVTLSMKSVGAQPMSYQWRFNGLDIPAGTTDTYELTRLQLSDGGRYSVIVSNALGATASREATLEVLANLNRPPLLPSQANRTINARSQLVVTNAAFDGDIPTNRLSYQLVEAPPEAIIDFQGVIHWIPSPADVPSSKVFTTVVTDDGQPPLRATNSFTVVVLNWQQTGPAAIVAGPIFNPVNPHQYFLLEPASWTDSEATAMAMGGHLVTINDQAEHMWLSSKFSSYDGLGRALWIGLIDPDPSITWEDGFDFWLNHFVWASGQSSSFFCWASPAPPSQGVGRIKMCNPTGTGNTEWAEEADQTLLNGVVEVPVSLQIVSQPLNVSVGFGCEATLRVVAESTAPIQYQWQFMGTNLPGATTSSLTLSNVQLSQSGPYCVLLQSDTMAITSAAALLSVQGIAAWGSTGSGVLNPPSNVTNVIAICGGADHALALREDGSVIGWGDHVFGQISVPDGLGRVIGIAAGNFFSLALKADGTVTPWGNNLYGELEVPAGLSNVVAIAGGGNRSLALKADGTVVGWGEALTIPPGLSNVVAIATGGGHDLILKADGTLAAWGNYVWTKDGWIKAYIPADLTNVIAISAAATYCLALRADDTVEAWGYDFGGATQTPELTNVVAICAAQNHSLALQADGTVVEWGVISGTVPRPANLPNTVAIAAGGFYSLALVRDGAPHLMVQPWDQTVPEGGHPCFIAKAVGSPSVKYQWRFNGNDVAAATHDIYTVSNAQPADAGVYTVTVSNSMGASTSRDAKLAVSSAPLITNQPPVLPPQPNRLIAALSELTVTNSAVDPDVPPNHLTYALIDPAPGAVISQDGIIHWTPGRLQGPSTNALMTVVTDDGAPSLSATNSFTVIVSAPLLVRPENWIVNVGQIVTFTNFAFDNDPERKLAFDLVTGPPMGHISSDTGVFAWRPTVETSGTTNRFEIRVTDDSTPSLSDVQPLTVIVNPLQPVEVNALSAPSGTLRFRITGTSGPDYIIQTSSDLLIWKDLQTVTPSLMPFDFADTNVSLTSQFYRVRVGP